ncbi:MAG: hypothetical protein NC299_18595 [Lachnospiraceae bacterium]|nr:hypothetical protein [Lachnospiraceae bacterium]
MINGKRCTGKMTWLEFTEWQRWDEFPERTNDPPMTVDVMFFYEGNEYYIADDYGQYHFYTKDWTSVYADENFLKLLTTPIDLFHGKSFEMAIGDLDFDL